MSRSKWSDLASGVMSPVLAVGLVLGAAGAAAAAPEGGKYEVKPVTDGGSLSGTVKWSGPPQAKKTLQVTKDHETCGQEVANQELLVGANGGLKNAIVSVDGIKAGDAFKADAPIVFDQKECLFLNRVTVVPVGATLDVRNSDNILHNTHFNAVKNKGENFAIPAGKAQTYPVKAVENIKVTCDIHPWMSSYVVARDNPYFAVTDDNGNFTIKNIPPGKYKVSVWQETVGKAGAAAVEIEIKAGAESKQDFELKPKG